MPFTGYSTRQAAAIPDDEATFGVRIHARRLQIAGTIGIINRLILSADSAHPEAVHLPETSSTGIPLTSRSGLEFLDFAAIALYLVGTFGIALWFSRKQKNVDDFFVGGRQMPWFAVGLSILATLFSTLSYLGSPGEMIKHGVGMFIGYLMVPFSAVVVMFLWIPFFMRLRLTSAYEYLERRYSYPVRLIGAVLFVLLRLGWMSMVMFAASTALDTVKGDDLAWLPGPDIYWWIGGVGLLAAIYNAVGGIQAMIWTDVLQCLLLLVGVLLAIGFVVLVDHTGPLDWWAIARTQSTAQHTSPPLFSLDPTIRTTIFVVLLNNFFWTICTHCSDQVVLQRYFSTSSLKAARRSYMINVAVDLTMGILLALCGLALLSFYLQHGSLLPAEMVGAGKSALDAGDKLFPYFLGHQLPVGCAGVVMAVFLCDSIQTLEAGVNSITAVISNDVVPRLRQGRPRIVSELTFARVLSVVITAMVVANAYFVTRYAQNHPTITLVSLMPRFFNLFVGPLAALFFIGMFLPRCTTRSVLPAVLAGLAASMCWSWYPEIVAVWRSWFCWIEPDAVYDPQLPLTPFLAIAVPNLVTVGTAAVLGFLLESGKWHAGRDFTWSAIVRGAPPAAPETQTKG